MLEDKKHAIWESFLKDRIIIFNDEIEDDILETVTMQVIRFGIEDDMAEKKEIGYDRKTKPIQIYINSRGGTVRDGLSCASSILSSKTPVITIAMGLAASAAFIVFLAGHTRKMQKHSSLMYHQISSWGFGRIQDQAEDLQESYRLQKVVDDIVTSRTKLDQTMLDQINMCKHDYYIDAKLARKYKCADVII